MSSRLPKSRLIALVSLGIAVGIPLLLRFGSEEEWTAETVRAFVDTLGIWGPIGMVTIVTLRIPLLLNTQIVLTVAGACFGWVEGTLYGSIGTFITGVTVFLAVRFLGQEAASKRVPPNLRRSIEKASSGWLAFFMAIGTALPFGPSTLYHVAASLTPMKLSTFVVALAVGVIPRALAYAALGDRLIEGGIEDAAWLGALMFVPWLALLHPKARAWMKHQFDPNAPAFVPSKPSQGA